MAGYNLCALISKLVDESGEGLTPSHAVKGDRRYRYYLSGAKEQSQAITSHASFFVEAIARCLCGINSKRSLTLICSFERRCTLEDRLDSTLNMDQKTFH